MYETQAALSRQQLKKKYTAVMSMYELTVERTEGLRALIIHELLNVHEAPEALTGCIKYTWDI